MSNFPEPDDHVRVALEIFGSRISGGAARDIAAHLPEPHATALTARARSSDEGEPGGTLDLTADLARRTGLEPTAAADLLTSTLESIRDRVPQETLERVGAQLPPELAWFVGRAEESAGRFTAGES